jgi:GNAT superfamily N-acetyltransferase
MGKTIEHASESDIDGQAGDNRGEALHGRGDNLPQVDRVSIRRLRADDRISDITALLHRAYRKQVEMGLKPLAGRQTDEVTAQRISDAECYVAVLPERDAAGQRTGRDRIVGTILFQEPSWGKGPEWFERPEVANFSQFAVDPGVQGHGIGQKLIDVCERRAAESGAAELALSTASPDVDLVAFYHKRGYRFIQEFQWGPTNYMSHILSKTIRPVAE